MKTIFKIYDEPEDDYTREPGEPAPSNDMSFHEDYSYQGDEFLDDAIRMVEQAFAQGNFVQQKTNL